MTRRKLYTRLRYQGVSFTIVTMILIVSPCLSGLTIHRKTAVMAMCWLTACFSFGYAVERFTFARRLLIKLYCPELIKSFPPEIASQAQAFRACCPGAHIGFFYPIEYLDNKRVLPYLIRVELDGQTFHVKKLP